MGGGVIPMLILFSIWGATWRSITKSKKVKTDEVDKED